MFGFRRFLKIALFQYVDDFFAPERRVHNGTRVRCVLPVNVGVRRPETMAHATECVGRLIELLLGQGAAAQEKLAYGVTLDVLGVRLLPVSSCCVCGERPFALQVNFRLSRKGFQRRPSAKKVIKWRKAIQEAIAKKHLPPGKASKLAGRLAWGGSNLFHRLGRAMLRPIFDQKSRRDGHTSPELLRALVWWDTALQLELAELRPWDDTHARPVHLFCDAAGSPAYLGAVLFDGDECWYTHAPPPAAVMEEFKHRNDNQIMGLELLSISLGFSTFEDRLQGRAVVVHSDNTGSEAAIRRGSAIKMDHAQLVHSQWLHAAENGMELFIRRVATDNNIADLPSRGVRHTHGVCGGLSVVACLFCRSPVFWNWPKQFSSSLAGERRT